MTQYLEYSNLIRTEYCPQLIIPELAKSIGLEEAVVIQQLHYWLQKSGKLFENNLWIYNSFNEWAKQFSYWSISKIKRVFYSLEARGLISSKKLNSSKHDHTKWYTIEYDKVLLLLPKSSSIRKKKGSLVFKEKSANRLYQLETNINSNTYTNSTHINNLSNEKDYKKEKPKKLLDKEVKTKTEISNSEKDICEQMIKIWYEVFIYQKDSILITKHRSIKLLNLWEKHFHKNLEEWKAYCISINSSKFLMGEKKSDFKARFDWLVSEEVANRVLSREFDIGDRVPDVESQASKIKAEEQRKVREIQRAEFDAKKALEEEKRRVELLAEKLASFELQKQESAWSDIEKEEIQKAFEDYMSQEVIEDDILASFKSIFSRDKWASQLISYGFEQFKIKFCLKKNFDDFVKEAKEQLMFVKRGQEVHMFSS